MATSQYWSPCHYPTLDAQLNHISPITMQKIHSKHGLASPLHINPNPTQLKFPHTGKTILLLILGTNVAIMGHCTKG